VYADSLSLFFRIARVEDYAPNIFLMECEKVRKGIRGHQNTFTIVVFKNDSVCARTVPGEVHNLWLDIQKTSAKIANAYCKLAIELDVISLTRPL
jgi:hypothetical protein